MQSEFNKLVRKQVEIVARGGVVYKGLFIEASEEAIQLKSETGWITVPMDRVVSVKELGAAEKEARGKDIDPSFFNNFK